MAHRRASGNPSEGSAAAWEEPGREGGSGKAEADSGGVVLIGVYPDKPPPKPHLPEIRHFVDINRRYVRSIDRLTCFRKN